MARRRRNRDIEMVGAVLGREKMLRSALGDLGAPVAPRDWEVAVGSKIAAHTKPTRLERGVLLVCASSAAWANELSLLVEPIIANLRKHGVDVRELRFRVGRIEPALHANRLPPKMAPSARPLDEPIRRSLEAVPDEDLRSAIAAAAQRSLGLRRTE